MTVTHVTIYKKKKQKFQLRQSEYHQIDWQNRAFFFLFLTNLLILYIPSIIYKNKIEKIPKKI